MTKFLTSSIAALCVAAFYMAVPTKAPEAISLTAVDSSYECALENKIFQDGESITYTLYYHLKPMWLKAGIATFQVFEEEDTYRFIAKGRTVSAFEWFYKVDDYYETVVRKSDLKPLTSMRRIREGSHRSYANATFDYTTDKIDIKRGKTEESAKDMELALTSCMQDILSIIYHARNMNFDDMEVGDRKPVDIYLDKKTYNLSFRYGGKEKKKVKKMGKRKTMKFHPQLVAGDVFKEDTEMTIWASDDENKLPLMIESPVSVGSVKVVLSRYENLKFPLAEKQ